MPSRGRWSWLLSASALGAATATSDAEQLHVSVRSSRSLTVSWASPSGQKADLVVERVIGELGQLETRVISPNSSSYQVQCGPQYSRSCRLPSIYSSPLLLHADFDVEPSALYRYRVGGGPRDGNWRRLRAPPAPGARELRVAVVGDIGQTSHSAATCRDLARAHAAEAIDVAVLLGDLAYADTDARRWDSFGRLFDEAGCSSVPWLTIPGNHEIEPDELSGECFKAYRYRWRAPEGPPEQVTGDSKVLDWGRYDLRVRYDFGNSFYGLQLGCLHIVALNPYTESSEGSPQHQWLEQELQRVDRKLTPHLMVIMHAPFLHSSRKHQVRHEIATFRLQHSSEGLLQQAHVDAIFSGHVHSYERSHPVDGTRHFVVGHGGNYEGLYDRWLSSKRSAFHSGDHYGWGVLELRPTSASWRARRSSDGVVVDSAQWEPRWNSSAGAFSPTPSGPGDDGVDGGADGPGSMLPMAVIAVVLIGLVTGAIFWRRLRDWMTGVARPEDRLGFKASQVEMQASVAEPDATGASPAVVGSLRTLAASGDSRA